jgi:hypothetical protein
MYLAVVASHFCTLGNFVEQESNAAKHFETKVLKALSFSAVLLLMKILFK